MMLAEFHAVLRNSPNIVNLARAVVTELATRNISPLDGVELHARGMSEADSLAERYAHLVAKTSTLASQTDLSDTSSIDGQNKYDGLRLALDFAQIPAGRSLDQDVFVRMAIYDLLKEYVPGIDNYVEHLKDVTLLDGLGLKYDDYMLVDISASNRFELRRHGLVVSATSMVYPHQFMRRFYGANFVNLPAMLRACIDEGLSVKLRIDPLRSWTDPQHYREIIEEDAWYGKNFDVALLRSTDSKELRTVRRTNDRHHPGHAVDFTIFRTSMMDDHQRQFMVEEYTPLVDPYSETRKLPGFGEKYCIQKFGHFVYDQRNDTFNHLDGAVRVFGLEEYGRIHEVLAKGKDPGSKIGDRQKLFLVEGELSLQRTQRLLYEFFMYNPHLEEYFGVDGAAIQCGTEG